MRVSQMMLLQHAVRSLKQLYDKELLYRITEFVKQEHILTNDETPIPAAELPAGIEAAVTASTA